MYCQLCPRWKTWKEWRSADVPVIMLKSFIAIGIIVWSATLSSQENLVVSLSLKNVVDIVQLLEDKKTSGRVIAKALELGAFFHSYSY